MRSPFFSCQNRDPPVQGIMRKKGRGRNDFGKNKIFPFFHIKKADSTRQGADRKLERRAEYYFCKKARWKNRYWKSCMESSES